MGQPLSTLINPVELRLRMVRPGDVDVTEGASVLLWVQRTQRSSANLAANLAIDLANDLGVPCIAAFCLVDGYPRATLRAYHFMAQGLAQLPDAFAKRGVGWELVVGDPAERMPELAARLHACVVVTDEAPTRDAQTWKTTVSERIRVPMVAVDADVVVPSALFPKLEWAARTIRPKIERVLDDYLIPIPEPVAHHKSDHRAGLDPMDAVEGLDIDRTIRPSPRFHGGQTAAQERFDWFAGNHLGSYDIDRNRSDIDGSSGLSPYLHFGQISPGEVAIRAREELAGNGGEALRSFFNELIIQRELAINFALRQPVYDSYEGLPDWGRKTLAAHAHDPREHIYSAEQLERGMTTDRLWNAAQRQMVVEGFMPNRLRMYWAKQILKWTESPEQAFDVAVSLNDRYFIDGRDPNGYAGIAWAIGGRHDRPFPPNKAVLGLVRPMGMKSMARFFDTEAYIRGVHERCGEADGEIQLT